ncbi:MAG: SDR family NAD(P)-dependent oxidoreductase [Clostridium sp.]|nr:SDR family NAD(P)-dependent oxidoreductase [Bacteroides sp.]MCM1197519.1 SDR family NAD(P)-dependent oxidoreductase [Clostridium sp.]
MIKITQDNFRGYGAYALVTGAASGMGRLYAHKLAQKGYSLILVDINSQKLEEVAGEIRSEVAGMEDFRAGFKDGFCLKTVVQDLSQQDAAEKVYAASDGCEVEVLVNNAGLMYCQTIANTSPKFLSLIMMVHNYTPLMLCRRFVPGMQQRGCGYVLNISSLAAWMAWPGIGMYGNTKRFVKGFSRSLRVECRGTGVSVTNAYFGAVDTPLVPLKPSLRKLARNLRVMITADRATDCALNATFKRRKGTMPGLLNRIFLPFIALMPDSALSWALKKLGPYILMKV